MIDFVNHSFYFCLFSLQRFRFKKVFVWSFNNKNWAISCSILTDLVKTDLGYIKYNKIQRLCLVNNSLKKNDKAIIKYYSITSFIMPKR